MAFLREAELDALMERLARGDRAAFDPLFAALRPRALRLAQATLPGADASDVAQTALLKVFARASDFTPGRPCLPWFYAIVANEVRAVRRRRVGVPLPDDGGPAVDAGGDPEHLLLVQELEHALHRAIDALDGDAAEALRAVLGKGPLPAVSPPTFRKRVSRAYARLRVALGGHDVR